MLFELDDDERSVAAIILDSLLQVSVGAVTSCVVESGDYLWGSCPSTLFPNGRLKADVAQQRVIGPFIIAVKT